MFSELLATEQICKIFENPIFSKMVRYSSLTREDFKSTQQTSPYRAVVVRAFVSNTEETEAGGSLSSRPAKATQ